jgi:hypothetical protein
MWSETSNKRNEPSHLWPVFSSIHWFSVFSIFAFRFYLFLFMPFLDFPQTEAETQITFSMQNHSSCLSMSFQCSIFLHVSSILKLPSSRPEKSERISSQTKFLSIPLWSHSLNECSELKFKCVKETNKRKFGRKSRWLLPPHLTSSLCLRSDSLSKVEWLKQMFMSCLWLTLS